MARQYTNTAVATTLSTGITSSDTSLTVAILTGYPTSFPYTILIGRGTASVEIAEVTAATGTTLTVTRGVDGSPAVAHSAGASVEHGVSARDFTEPRDLFLVAHNTDGTLKVAAVQTLTLATNWGAFGSGYNGQVSGTDAVRYWKDNGHVCLDGLAKWNGSGTTAADAVIGTLPATYRPGFRVMFSCYRSDTATVVRVDVLTTGEVELHASGLAVSGYVSLSGIRFRAEA